MMRNGSMNPKLLLVEDDPITSAFLTASSLAIHCDVETATCLAQAFELAISHVYDAWLFDANLPDGSGAQLLARLRDCGLKTRALAHTASHDAQDALALRQAGFDEVLIKPISAAGWQAAIQRVLAVSLPTQNDALPGSTQTDMLFVPIWDDAAAAQTMGGNLEHVRALRGLFLQELPGQRNAIRDGDTATRHHHLHRLRASCGFVGARRLDAAATALHAHPDNPQALQTFLECAEQLLDTQG